MLIHSNKDLWVEHTSVWLILSALILRPAKKTQFVCIIAYKASNPAQMPNCYSVPYLFISAYPFIKFDEKFHPIRLLEPTHLLER
jgi:hypothetical protein